MTGAALWPFLEQWITGDRREHHINQRPRNAPTRTALGIAMISFYGVLWLEGSNDILADHFDVPLYTITEIARVAIFAVPIIAYILTKRICLGLQRKDLHLMQHGVEMGIIRQLPDGEFIEETRPLNEEELAKLALPEQLALPAGESESDADSPVPAPGLRGGLGRVKARLNKLVTESVPANGANGYGSNGHGDHAESEHAAISSGSDEDHH
jgi:ubiquinol-cytochrome c reductase cytochrome b subunit